MLGCGVLACSCHGVHLHINSAWWAAEGSGGRCTCWVALFSTKIRIGSRGWHVWDAALVRSTLWSIWRNAFTRCFNYGVSSCLVLYNHNQYPKKKWVSSTGVSCPRIISQFFFLEQVVKLSEPLYLSEMLRGTGHRAQLGMYRLSLPCMHNRPKSVFSWQLSARPSLYPTAVGTQQTGALVWRGSRQKRRVWRSCMHDSPDSTEYMIWSCDFNSRYSILKCIHSFGSKVSVWPSMHI